MNYSNLCFGCFEEKQNQVCEHCGFDPAVQKEQMPLALAAGTILGGRFALGKVTGNAQSSIGYAGFDLKLEKPVNINEYVPQSVHAREDDGATLSAPADSNEFRNGLNRFIEEAKIVAAIPGNPALVDFIYENNTAYTVFAANGENAKLPSFASAPVTEAPPAQKHKFSPALILACAAVLLAVAVLIIVLMPGKTQTVDAQITPNPSITAEQLKSPEQSPVPSPSQAATAEPTPTPAPTPEPTPSPASSSAPIPYTDYESSILGCSIRYPLGFEVKTATKELPTEMFVSEPHIIQLTRYKNKTAVEWLDEVKKAVEGVEGEFELMQEGKSVSGANEYDYLTYYIMEEAQYYTATLVMQAGKDIFVLDSATYSSDPEDFNECASIMIEMIGTLKIAG